MQVPDEAATAKKQAEADEAARKEGKEQADPVEPQTKSQSREEWDWAVQNDSKPLWTRSPREVFAPGMTGRPNAAVPAFAPPELKHFCGA